MITRREVEGIARYADDEGQDALASILRAVVLAMACGEVDALAAHVEAWRPGRPRKRKPPGHSREVPGGDRGTPA